MVDSFSSGRFSDFHDQKRLGTLVYQQKHGSGGFGQTGFGGHSSGYGGGCPNPSLDFSYICAAVLGGAAVAAGIAAAVAIFLFLRGGKRKRDISSLSSYLENLTTKLLGI